MVAQALGNPCRAQVSDDAVKLDRCPVRVTGHASWPPRDDLPVHSFRTLLADLPTLTGITIVTAIPPDGRSICWRPTPVQRRAYQPLEVALQSVTAGQN